MDTNLDSTQILLAQIAHDAREKAEELEIITEYQFLQKKKAHLEYHKKQLDKHYDDKEKKMLVEHMIFLDHSNNECKLRLQKARSEYIQAITEELRQNIIDVTKSNKYKTLLKKLLEQAVYMMLEDKIIIKARKSDIAMLKEMLPDISKNFEKETNIKINITFDESSYLNDDAIGGVIVSCKNGRIRIDNTFSTRIIEIVERSIPLIKQMLI